MLNQETMLIMTIAVHLVIALAMVIYLKTQKTYPGFGYWTISNVLAALMYILIASRPYIPVFFSIILGNLIAVLALRIRYEGVLAFTGRALKLNRNTSIFFILLGMLLAFLTYVEDNSMNRLIVISILLSYYAIMIAIHLVKESHDGANLTAWSIAAAHILYVLLLNARTFSWVIDPSLRNLLTPSLVNVIYIFTEHTMDILVAIAFIMLNNQRMAKELSESQRKLESLATTDPLTGIGNRLKLYEQGRNEIIRSRRFNHPFSVIMFDLDYFKGVNDTYGHPAGDRLLIELTSKIKGEIRDIDFFGRLGGDEFVLLLPETSVKECYSIAERIRAAIDTYSLQWEENQIRVSVSIGIAELSDEDSNLDDLISRVDKSLYRSKQSGRNMTSGFQ